MLRFHSCVFKWSSDKDQSKFSLCFPSNIHAPSRFIYIDAKANIFLATQCRHTTAKSMYQFQAASLSCSHNTNAPLLLISLLESDSDPKPDGYIISCSNQKRLPSPTVYSIGIRSESESVSGNVNDTIKHFCKCSEHFNGEMSFIGRRKSSHLFYNP